MKLKSIAQDLWIGIGLVSVCLLAFFVIIPREVEDEIQRGLPPTFFPNLSVIWIGAFSLILLLKSLFPGTVDPQPRESAADTISGRKGAIFTIFASIFYLILCSLVSFVISTIVTLAILMWTLGERRWHFIVTATLVTTLGIYIVFGWLMSVQLPEGIFF